MDQYPLPKSDDLFSTLAGGVQFTKLDLKHAYQQLLLEESSKNLVTILTLSKIYTCQTGYHLECLVPLPFFRGQWSKFYKEFYTFFVTYIVDDILITGRTEKEHLTNLRSAMLSRTPLSIYM